MPAHYSWKRLGLWLVVVVALTGLWWYVVRPPSMVRQARALLTTDPDAAAVLLEDAVASSLWSMRDAEVLWARALVRSGRGEEALGCFGLIQSPERADADGLIDLADDAQLARMTLLAGLALQAVPASSPRRSDAVQRLIDIRLQTGESPLALQLAGEWAELQPKSPAPWLAMARTHEQQMMLKEAIQCYREALARESDATRRIEVQRSLVRLLILFGEREDARALQTEIRSAESIPTLTDHLHEAYLRRLEGDIDGAWSEVEQVLKSDANQVAALELRGTLAMDRHDYARAETDLQTVLQRQPINKAAHYKLAQTLAKLGREPESEAHFAENRRLLKLSTRILDLQSRTDRTAEGTAELIQALEETGLNTAAERLKRSAK